MVQVIIRSRLDKIVSQDKKIPQLSKEDILEVSKPFIRKSSKELKMRPSDVIKMISSDIEKEYYAYQQAMYELELMLDEEERVKEENEVPQYQKEYLYAISDVAIISGLFRNKAYSTQAIRLQRKAGDLKTIHLEGLSEFVMESDLLNYIFNKFKRKVTETELVKIRKHIYKAPKYKGD